MLDLVKELYEYRSMVSNLVRRELRGRYKGSVLGFLWNFVIPLMQIVVYIMVFTIVFRQNIEDYYVYLIVGMIPWFMFSDSLSSGSGSVVEQSQLITKIYFPRSVIPVSVVLSKFVNFLISMVIVLFVIAVGGHGMDIYGLLSVPISIVLLLVFTIGLTLILAAANVYMRDVQYMVTVLLMILIWLTPIMYVTNFIDNDMFQLILHLNPMTYFIGMFQDGLYWRCFPTMENLLASTVLSVVTIIVGAYVYDKASADFAEVL